MAKTTDTLRKRKAAVHVAGRGRVGGELAPAKVLRFQSQEAFFDEAARDLADARAGRGRRVATVSFASVSALLAVLTPKRYALVEAVKAQGRFESIEALATAVGRDRAAVSRDLKALTEAGLLRMQEAILPGHGRRSTIAPVARHLKVELAL